MKEQEAINLLDNLVGMIEDNHNSDYDKAFKMGIEALKKQAGIERALKRLEKELELAEKDMERCVFKGLPQYDTAKGYSVAISNAIEIIKEEVGYDDSRRTDVD